LSPRGAAKIRAARRGDRSIHPSAIGANMNSKRRANASHQRIANADSHDGEQAHGRRALSTNIDRCKKNNDFIERCRVTQRASSISLQAFERRFVRNHAASIIKRCASRSDRDAARALSANTSV